VFTKTAGPAGGRGGFSPRRGGGRERELMFRDLPQTSRTLHGSEDTNMQSEKKGQGSCSIVRGRRGPRSIFGTRPFFLLQEDPGGQWEKAGWIAISFSEFGKNKAERDRSENDMMSSSRKNLVQGPDTQLRLCDPSWRGSQKKRKKRGITFLKIPPADFGKLFLHHGKGAKKRHSMARKKRKNL